MAENYYSGYDICKMLICIPEGYPLHRACRTGNIELIESLIKLGFDINKVYKNNISGEYVSFTPLHYSCFADKNNDKIAKLLIESGADIDKIKNKYDETGIDYSCKYGDLETLKLKFNHKNTIKMLQYAINGNHLNVVKFLIELKVNINHVFKDKKDNKSILQYAIEKCSNSKILDLLVENGAILQPIVERDLKIKEIKQSKCEICLIL